MRAVSARQVDEVGFELRRILERADSTQKEANGQVKKVRYLVRDKLPGTFLINADASTDSLTVLTFDNLMQVTYTREREPVEYLRSLSPFGPGNLTAGSQTSMMHLTQPAVMVEKNGNFYDQLALVFEGYWGWEKMADLLPLTYQP